MSSLYTSLKSPPACPDAASGPTAAHVPVAYALHWLLALSHAKLWQPGVVEQEAAQSAADAAATVLGDAAAAKPRTLQARESAGPTTRWQATAAGGFRYRLMRSGPPQFCVPSPAQDMPHCQTGTRVDAAFVELPSQHSPPVGHGLVSLDLSS